IELAWIKTAESMPILVSLNEVRCAISQLAKNRGFTLIATFCIVNRIIQLHAGWGALKSISQIMNDSNQLKLCEPICGSPFVSFANRLDSLQLLSWHSRSASVLTRPSSRLLTVLFYGR